MARKKGSEGIEKDFKILEDGIKKLLDSTQEERFEELSENMEEKMDERLSSFRDELERRIDNMKKERVDIASFLAEIRKNRERIARMEGRVSSFKKQDSTTKSGLENDIHREFERIRDDVKQGTTENTETIKIIEAEMANIRERIGEIKMLGDGLKGLDMESLARDIEVLKQKTHWLEENIEKLDIQPLFERIREIEEDLRATRGESPLIIE
jgi:hypothetical protein